MMTTAERLLTILATRPRYATHGVRELRAARALAHAGQVHITEHTEWVPVRHGCGQYGYTRTRRVTYAVCTRGE